jgi:predicted acylesterase/phospholipase RssA
MKDLAITFAGGGNRAFYQLGLWNRWGERLLPHTAMFATCSAGACVACLILSERATVAAGYWRERVEGVRRNFDWPRLLRRERPTPHEPIYRATLRFAFGDGGLERVRACPFPVWVLTTGFSPRVPATAAVAVGLSAYNIEKKRRPTLLHPTYGRKLGFFPRVFDARSCTTVDELVDLIVASSATPPFTGVGRFRDEWLLDGGLIDNAPAYLADEGPAIRRSLVLLTRPYPAAALERAPSHRVYVAPTRPTPIERWDYTRPHLLEQTIRMGEEEADRRVDVLERLGV